MSVGYSIVDFVSLQLNFILCSKISIDALTLKCQKFSPSQNNRKAILFCSQNSDF